MNLHNKQLAAQGKKRRAKFLHEILSGKTPNELAIKYNLSSSRVRWMLKKAKGEI